MRYTVTARNSAPLAVRKPAAFSSAGDLRALLCPKTGSFGKCR